MKETSNIEGFEIFYKKFIYTAYTDDTTFFLKNSESDINLLEIFKHFSHFSGLKPNKCEIAGVNVLKYLRYIAFSYFIIFEYHIGANFYTK